MTIATRVELVFVPLRPIAARAHRGAHLAVIRAGEHRSKSTDRCQCDGPVVQPFEDHGKPQRGRATSILVYAACSEKCSTSSAIPLGGIAHEPPHLAFTQLRSLHEAGGAPA
jgi:hypothetical protein